MEHPYQVVHHRGQPYILIDVTDNLPIVTPNEKDQLIIVDEFQECADKQNLRGKVVLIWPNKDRRVMYLSRPSSDLHHLLKNVMFDSIISKSDGNLTCPF
jgi:hypothetical protein